MLTGYAKGLGSSGAASMLVLLVVFGRHSAMQAVSNESLLQTAPSSPVAIAVGFLADVSRFVYHSYAALCVLPTAWVAACIREAKAWRDFGLSDPSQLRRVSEDASAVGMLVSRWAISRLEIAVNAAVDKVQARMMAT